MRKHDAAKEAGRRFVAILIAMVCLLGCSDKDKDMEALKNLTRTNIQKATAMYTIYLSSNNYKGPDSLQQLITFLRSGGERDMVEMKIDFAHLDLDHLEQYCISDRDHQSYDFRWGIDSSPNEHAMPLVFERVGVDGVRWVGISGGVILKVTDDAKYQELWQGVYEPNDTN